MFDYSGFFTDVKGLIITLIHIYIYIIVIRAVISWFNPSPHNPLVQFLRGVTDPALNAVRSFLPRFFWSTGIDFTPLILVVLLWLVISFFQNLLPAADRERGQAETNLTFLDEGPPERVANPRERYLDLRDRGWTPGIYTRQEALRDLIKEGRIDVEVQLISPETFEQLPDQHKWAILDEVKRALVARDPADIGRQIGETQASSRSRRHLPHPRFGLPPGIGETQALSRSRRLTGYGRMRFHKAYTADHAQFRDHLVIVDQEHLQAAINDYDDRLRTLSAAIDAGPLDPEAEIRRRRSEVREALALLKGKRGGPLREAVGALADTMAPVLERAQALKGKAARVRAVDPVAQKSLLSGYAATDAGFAQMLMERLSVHERGIRAWGRSQRVEVESLLESVRAWERAPNRPHAQRILAAALGEQRYAPLWDRLLAEVDDTQTPFEIAWEEQATKAQADRGTAVGALRALTPHARARLAPWLQEALAEEEAAVLDLLRGWTPDETAALPEETQAALAGGATPTLAQQQEAVGALRALTPQATGRLGADLQAALAGGATAIWDRLQGLSDEGKETLPAVTQAALAAQPADRLQRAFREMGLKREQAEVYTHALLTLRRDPEAASLFRDLSSENVYTRKKAQEALEAEAAKEAQLITYGLQELELQAQSAMLTSPALLKMFDKDFLDMKNFDAFGQDVSYAEVVLGKLIQEMGPAQVLEQVKQLDPKAPPELTVEAFMAAPHKYMTPSLTLGRLYAGGDIGLDKGSTVERYSMSATLDENDEQFIGFLFPELMQLGEEYRRRGHRLAPELGSEQE